MSQKTQDDLQVTCMFCHKNVAKDDAFPVAMLQPALKKKLLQTHPHLVSHNMICTHDIRCTEALLMEECLRSEVGILTPHDHLVLESIKASKLTTRNLNHHYDKKLTIGQRIADRLSIVAGSWGFIIGFLVFLLGWMAINSWQMIEHPYDPYPYILLNLVLSCLAAIQAPMILMSQNRQAQRDRIEAENDYHINMISELQIRQLHEKLDILLKAEWERSVEK